MSRDADIDRAIAGLTGEKSDADLDRETDELIAKLKVIGGRDPAARESVQHSIKVLLQIRKHRRERRELEEEAP